MKIKLNNVSPPPPPQIEKHDLAVQTVNDYKEEKSFKLYKNIDFVNSTPDDSLLKDVSIKFEINK